MVSALGGLASPISCHRLQGGGAGGRGSPGQKRGGGIPGPSPSWAAGFHCLRRLLRPSPSTLAFRDSGRSPGSQGF